MGWREFCEKTDVSRRQEDTQERQVWWIIGCHYGCMNQVSNYLSEAPFPDLRGKSLGNYERHRPAHGVVPEDSECATICHSSLARLLYAWLLSRDLVSHQTIVFIQYIILSLSPNWNRRTLRRYKALRCWKEFKKGSWNDHQKIFHSEICC